MLSPLAQRIREPRPDLVPRYVPLPLDAIGRSLDKLDYKQEKGLEAFSKTQELYTNLLNQVIPDPIITDRAKALLGDIDETLSGYAESGNFINARPALVATANRLQSSLAPFVRDYQGYKAAQESIAKIRESSDGIFTAADEYAAIGRPLEAMRKDPNARFKAGAISPRLDTDKYLNDFVKEYDPEGRIEFTSNGFIVKSDHIDKNRVMQDAKNALLNNPRYMQGLKNDIDYQLAANLSTPEDVETFVNNNLDSVADEVDRINSDDSLTPGQKAQALSSLEELRGTIISDPIGFARNSIKERIVSNVVEPYANRTQKNDITGIQDNPFVMEGLRQQNRIQLEGIRHQNALTRDRLKETVENSNQVTLAPGRSFQELYGTKSDVEKRISNLSNGTQEEKAEANLLQHKLEITKDEFFDVSENLGISKGEYEEIKREKDNISKRNINPLGLSGFAASQQISADYGAKNRIEEELTKKYGNKYQAFKEVDKRLDDYIKAGHGVSDQTLVVTDTKVLNAIEKVIERSDPTDWVSTDVDRDDLKEMWKDLKVIGPTTDGTQVELIFPGDKNRERQVVRVAQINPNENDSIGLILNNLGDAGKGVARERQLSSIKLGKNYTNVGNTNIKMRAEGRSGVVVALENDALVVNDMFDIARELPKGSEQENALLWEIIGRLEGQTNMNPKDIVKGFRGEELSRDKQIKFNNLLSNDFIFRSKGEALDNAQIVKQLRNK